MSTDLRTLPDLDLERLARQLERKVAALKFATTALGARLLERYAGMLQDVELEILRRKV
jgi:hypothetical protein